jgi:hypothetical protein
VAAVRRAYLEGEPPAAASAAAARSRYTISRNGKLSLSLGAHAHFIRTPVIQLSRFLRAFGSAWPWLGLQLALKLESEPDRSGTIPYGPRCSQKKPPCPREYLPDMLMVPSASILAERELGTRSTDDP